MQEKGLYSINSIGVASVLDTNKVLKNTYLLLGMTLLFSAFSAGISIAIGLGPVAGPVLMLGGLSADNPPVVRLIANWCSAA